MYILLNMLFVMCSFEHDSKGIVINNSIAFYTRTNPITANTRNENIHDKGRCTYYYSFRYYIIDRVSSHIA